MATELFRIPIDDLKSNDDVNPDIRSIAVRNNKLYIAVNDDRSPVIGLIGMWWLYITLTPGNK